MIIGSLNIRGGGSWIKRKRISCIIQRGKADVFFIQESKLRSVSDIVARSFWGNSDVDFSFSESEGRSGGIIILWKASTISVVFSFRGTGFMGIKVSWKNKFYYLVNVYAACSLSTKCNMWKELVDLKQKFRDGDWLIGGDFNAIKKRSERVGSSLYLHRSEWGEFSNFIDSCGLIDVPCKGKKFSWFRGDGETKSRLDRFLVDSNIVSNWGVVGQLIGQRDVSDHCPVWLVIDKENWGPKPFKFNNEWFNNKDFLLFVEFEWKAIIISGRGDFVLKEKFRIIKERLKWWNITVFGKFDLEVEEGVRELNEADDCDVFDDEIQALKRIASSRLWLNLRIKENMLIQKSRLKWLNDGDSNSKYFHSVMKERRRRNHIGSITTPSGIIDEVGEVKEEVWRHFDSKFKEANFSRPVLDNVEFNSFVFGGKRFP
ncbi:uncharacterized protein LOC131614433 [Vicia villosa]|uniref:uncharacterized protein LOC131614433 n=1 Tax=Vicia villosa TaxID=3911 RepID=UPI00273BEA36|nr:uncharacterized protein LOC131614433 [Vicia villosa]